MLMKKNFMCMSLALCALLFNGNSSKLFAKGGGNTYTVTDAVNNSSVIVVLLEPNEKYVQKLSKKGKQKELDVYEGAIKSYNDNMQAIAPQYFKMGKAMLFKTLSDIEKFTPQERQSYTYILYNRAVSYSGNGADVHGCDMDNSSQKAFEKSVSDYEDAMTFEWINDPKFDNDPDYRMLSLYAPTSKDVSGAVSNVQANLADISPTKGDLIIALKNLQYMVQLLARNTDDKTSMKEKRKAMRDEADAAKAAGIAVIKRRTLLVSKAILAKGVTSEAFKANYPYPVKIAEPDEVDKVITSGDTTYCVLMVVPLMKVPGMPGSVPIKYSHQIYDPASSNGLLAVMSGKVVVNGFGMGGYEQITVDGIKDITDEMKK